MWVYETQSQMINSSAAIMRAFAVAAATTMSASACQGMKVWSGLLKAEPAIGWSPLSSWQAWTLACSAQWSTPRRSIALAPAAAATQPEEVKAAAPAGGSSYRSDGGHAVAQVIIGS